MSRKQFGPQVMGLLIPSCNMPNLLSLRQVDPQLPPGGEFLPVTEVVGHFLAGIPGHQRWAVLHEVVSSLHVGEVKRLVNTRGPVRHLRRQTHTNYRRSSTRLLRLLLSWITWRQCWFTTFGVGVRREGFVCDICSGVRQSGATACLNTT